MINLRISALPLVVLFFFAISHAPEVSQNTAPSAGSVSNIRQIDFKNFTFVKHRGEKGTDTIEFRHGKYIGTDGLNYSLMRITYGDLTGDGSEEAVLLLRGQNTPVSRTLDEIFIYTLEKGRVVAFTNFECGKRGDYILSVGSLGSNFKVEDNQLVIDHAIAQEDDPDCIPTRYSTIKYQWDDRRMTEIERSSLKPIPEHMKEIG
jgi:hypothetical protein